MSPQCALTPYYFPPIVWFKKAFEADQIILECCGGYQKQSYQNRCYVLTAQGLHKLIIPVQHATIHGIYKEVKPDYSVPWVRQHIRTLTTAYNQTPFYGALADMLHPVLLKKPTYLCDLNMALLEVCFSFLQCQKKMLASTKYQAILPKDTLDARVLFHPKKLTPAQSNVALHYPQLFSGSCAPQLSIIDILCSQGPRAHTMLLDSQTTFQTECGLNDQ